MIIYLTASAFFNGTTSLVLALYVLLKNARSHVNRTFSFFAFTVAFWSFAYFFWLLAREAETALFFARLLMLGSIFIPSSCYHFIMTFGGMKNEKRVSIIAGYCMSALFSLTDATTLFVSGVEPRLGFLFWPTPGPFFHPFMLFFHAYPAAALLTVLGRYRSLPALKRKQFKYIALGTALAFIGGTTNHFLWYNIPIPPYGNILVVTYVACAAYAIVKYRLLDISVTLRQWTIFTAIYIVTFSIPIITAVTRETNFMQEPDSTLWTCFYIAGGALNLLAQFLYNRISVKTGDRIQREQNLYHDFLRRASTEMLHLRDVVRLKERIVSVLGYDGRISCVALFTREEPSPFFMVSTASGPAARPRPGAFITEEHPLAQLLIREQGIVFSGQEGAATRPGTGPHRGVDETMALLDADLVIPLFSRRRLFGFITITARERLLLDSEDYIHTLYTFANQCSLAIENALLYQNLEQEIVQRTTSLNLTLQTMQEDLQKAKIIQEKILPREDEGARSLDMRIAYLPRHEIGGDLYDITALQKYYYRIFLADAIGHGIRAALVTMLIKSEYDKLKKIAENPARLLDQLNREFSRNHGSLMVFFTCIVVDIDMINNRVLYSSAGHVRQFLATRGAIEPLHSSGRIIGVVEESRYGLNVRDYDPGDRLILFSDGIIKQENERKEEFGLDRLGQVIMENRDVSIQDCVSRVLAALREHASGPPGEIPGDDVTILGIERRPSPA